LVFHEQKKGYLTRTDFNLELNLANEGASFGDPIIGVEPNIF